MNIFYLHLECIPLLLYNVLVLTNCNAKFYNCIDRKDYWLYSTVLPCNIYNLLKVIPNWGPGNVFSLFIFKRDSEIYIFHVWVGLNEFQHTGMVCVFCVCIKQERRENKLGIGL